MLEKSQNFVFDEPKLVQKNIMGAKNINVLVGEN
jgi:hypothetical protein